MKDLKLHLISADAIPAALEMARQYRSLQEPQQAESICLDILAVQPECHDVQVVLILALTDQFTHSGQALDVKRVLALIEVLSDEYERLYFKGLVIERRARALLRESMSRSFAYDYFREAMHWYERAQAIHNEHHDNALLRWNSCLRTLRYERLQPRAEQDEACLDMEC